MVARNIFGPCPRRDPVRIRNHIQRARELVKLFNGNLPLNLIVTISNSELVRKFPWKAILTND